MGFSEKIKDFYKIFFPVFLTQISVPGFNQSTKSTDLVDLAEVDRSGRSTDVHKSVHVWQLWDGRPGRSTGLRAVLSVCLGRPCRSTVVAQRSHFWPLAVDRAGRPLPVRAASSALTASFVLGLYKPHLFGFLAKIFKEKNFWFLKCLKQVFKSVLGFKLLIWFVFWVFGKSKKTRFWDFDLIFHFLSFTRDFPISFSLLLVSKNTLFPLELSSILIYLGSCFVKKEKGKRFVVERDHLL